jgi:hypothetical protein
VTDEALAAMGVVGVGSEAGEQIRDQSNGSMADEAIERVSGRNLRSGLAKVKWLTDSGNTRATTKISKESKKT